MLRKKMTFHLITAGMMVCICFTFIKCKNQDSNPSTASQNNLPFQIQMISNSKGIDSGAIKVNPGESIEFILRATSDQKIIEIDGLVTDWFVGTTYLNGFPMTTFSQNNNSYGVKVTSDYDISITKKISIPSYARDSIILKYEVVNYLNKKVEKKIVFLVQNKLPLSIAGVNFSINNNYNTKYIFYSGQKVSFNANIQTTYPITDVNGTITYNNSTYSISGLSLIKNIYGATSNYNDYENNSLYSYYISANLLSLSGSLIGNTYTVDIGIQDSNGGTATGTGSFRTAYIPISGYSSINLGTPQNTSFDSFYDIEGNYVSTFAGSNGYNNINTDLGVFYLSGELQLGSTRYISSNGAQLGYSSSFFLTNYGNYIYFKNASVPFNQITSQVLDTVSIDYNYPQTITISPGQVIFFIKSSSGNKGAITINSLVNSNDGSINFSTIVQNPAKE